MKASSLLHPNRATGLFGLVLGLIAIGSPAGSGALVNLDLIAVGDLDAPRSLVALGPEIPRRAPLQFVWAILSPPLSAASVTRIWMILVIAVAFAGVAKYLEDIAWPIAWGAGTVYALSPFLLTRVAVGHLGFATAVALLPWAIATLAHPLTSPRSTAAWLCTFALCGYFGALVAGPVVLVGLGLQRRRPTAIQVLVTLATQIPWLAPALVAIGDATGDVGAGSFDSHISSFADVLRLPLGFGFWRDSNQLGGQHAWSVLVALLLLLFAFIGIRWAAAAEDVGRVLSALALVGIGVTAASVVPGVRTVYDDLTGFVAFAPVREGQKLLVFAVLAVVVFAARGIAFVTTGTPAWVRMVSGGLLGGAVLVATGGALWGLDGATVDHRVPPSWNEAAELVSADPGVTLALPWTQYFDIAIADGRRGHNPVPFLLGGDVVFRHDLGLGATGRTSRDDREDEVTVLLRALRFGEPIHDRVGELGVAWIVALPDTGTDDIDRLRASSAVRVAFDSPEIVVFAGGGGARDGLTDWTTTATLIVALDVVWTLSALTVVARPRV